MCAKSLKKLREIIDSGLCTRCGSCVGLSKGRIRFHDKTDRYLPVIEKPVDDELADRLWHACSGKIVDFPKINNYVFGGSARTHKYLGICRDLNIGFCKDQDVRRICGSGGIITATLLWLLEKKKIEGAVVLKMSDRQPWMNKPFIATTHEEIISAAQSKYIISSVNELLPEIENFHGPLAYVGLPCQVHSIRKLQMENDPSVADIKYIIAPFCGLNLHFSSIKSFLRSHKGKDYTKISNLQFRYGQWPGSMRIEMKDGKVFQLPKFHANYLIPFHIMKRCLLCTDLTNEFTDISVGDAWAPVYEERGKGFSLVLARSEKGQEILYRMKDEGLISLDKLESKVAVSMHSHGYDLKKRGAFIRIRFRKFFGRAVPNYGYELKGFPVKRYLMEILIDFMFALMGTSLASFLLEKIHPKFMGGVFKKLRTIWKKLTHNIKREEFYVDKW